jgi:DNA-binding beta-propeller fold protein YncE
VYVLEGEWGQVFDSDGNYLRHFFAKSGGKPLLPLERGVAADSVGNVYISDARNCTIQKQDNTGEILEFWVTGDPEWENCNPRSLAVNSLGYVYVIDTDHYDHIQKYDGEGNLLHAWRGGMLFPNGIAVDSIGHVYVVDLSGNRVQKFDANGVLLDEIGGSGAGNGQFDGPEHVAIDAAGNVYVTDKYNNRVQKFAPIADSFQRGRFHASESESLGVQNKTSARRHPREPDLNQTGRRVHRQQRGSEKRSRRRSNSKQL